MSRFTYAWTVDREFHIGDLVEFDVRLESEESILESKYCGWGRDVCCLGGEGNGRGRRDRGGVRGAVDPEGEGGRARFVGLGGLL